MIAPKQVERRISDFVAACRRQGIKATHQRTEILRELAGTDAHPDAETIYAGVRRRIPAISLDTVYRTLRLLEEKGVISRVGAVRDRARFDANTDRHHHFICSRCGLIRDFRSRALDRFTPPAEVTALGRVDSVHVELTGRCRKCRRNTKEEKGTCAGKQDGCR
jgi:Fur family peroxide stress response transcriptional regulator